MTFSPELSTVIAGFAVLIAAVSWYYAFRCWDFCRDTERFIKKLMKQDTPALSKLSKLEAELTEHADSIAALHDSLKLLRAKVGMRINRAAKSDSEPEIPDPNADPAGYKRAMRLKLREKGMI